MHVTALANMSLIALTTCIFYTIITLRYGTPLMDSLSLEQQRTRRASTQQRAGAFVVSTVAACLVVLAVRVPR